MARAHLAFGTTLLALLSLSAGCGDDTGTDDDTGGNGGNGASAGSGGSGGSTGGSGGSGGSGGFGGSPGDVACGAETCTGGDVCIVRPQEAACENKLDPNDPCPPAMPNDTFCGGAGIPCCCAAPPDPLYECSPAAGCGGVVDCDCLMDECPSPMLCAEGLPGTFTCESPPAP